MISPRQVHPQIRECFILKETRGCVSSLRGVSSLFTSSFFFSRIYFTLPFNDFKFEVLNHLGLLLTIESSVSCLHQSLIILV